MIQGLIDYISEQVINITGKTQNKFISIKEFFINLIIFMSKTIFYVYTMMVITLLFSLN